MLNIDSLIGGFVELAYRALMGFADVALFVAILALGFCAIALVMTILVWIIDFVIKLVKILYEAVKAHYNRSYDCEYCIAQKNLQASLEDDGPHITEEEAKDNFDEDARTIVDEEIGKSSFDPIEQGYSGERDPLLKGDGQHSIEEVRETLHDDARMFVGEGNSKSSVHLNEKSKSEERYNLFEDDDEHTIK